MRVKITKEETYRFFRSCFCSRVHVWVSACLMKL